MPAYPVCGVDGVWHLGMSIRDYFANGPMTEAEFETLREAYSLKFPQGPFSISRMRYWRAETMLEAREQWYNEHQTPAPVVTPPVEPEEETK
jgi:hypothetical protein